MTGNNESSPDVAIIGGGVIGVMTALGLLHRSIKVVIYERASSWHEIGAGFAFTGVARECMQQLDPAILEVLNRISEKTASKASTSYWDAYHPRTRQDAEDESKSLLFQMPGNKLAFWGCVRSQFLLGMASLLPDGVVKFGKQLVSYDDDNKEEKVRLHFDDGTTAEAHAVLGCDGIHSTTRRILLGVDHPAARTSYTHTVAYRTMVPIDAGITALGKAKATSACMHCGPNANMMSYPVMNGTLLNVAIFVHESPEFPDPETMTAPATRGELELALNDWGPHVVEITKLFPEKLVKWGIFDMDRDPAPTYAHGRVCIVGDAAHASSPFQGVGACVGVEDALALCEALGAVQNQGTEAISRALQAYSQSRIERGQWVVRSSREMGQMYQWRYGPTGRDAERCKLKLERASQKVWDYDVSAMVARVKAAAA
ncbi:putative salicylate hydroxylase [Hypomontagnella monticulosa]|nr:putative salicylate hydroxylase [Hypomontagnella monticulosa]